MTASEIFDAVFAPMWERFLRGERLPAEAADLFFGTGKAKNLARPTGFGSA